MILSEETIKWLVKKKNNLFLWMCLGVHILLLLLFLYLQIWGVSVLNILSVVFYVFLILKKDFSSRAIVATYFEIIIFAFLATIMLGRQAGFLLYIVGMISVVFYLAYSHGNRRFVYQGIGVAMAIAVAASEPLFHPVFLEYKQKILPYSNRLFVMNLIVTVVTLAVISYLYAQEINYMTQEITKMNSELDYKASHDPLTRLMNRYFMGQYLDEIQQDMDKQVVVGMMDIDDFKKLNDTYGHGAGDAALMMLAHMARKHLKLFRVARWGGEEFLLVGENIEWEKACVAVKVFHTELQKREIQYENHTFTIHVTVGLYSGSTDRNLQQMIGEADRLLYTGKNATKNCIVTKDNVQKYQ